MGTPHFTTLACRVTTLPIMKTTLFLVGCMVAVAMSQYVPEVPAHGDINNDGIPNYLDLNYDGKVDAHVYHHGLHGLHGLYAHHLYKRSVHPHVHHAAHGHAHHGHAAHAVHGHAHAGHIHG